jgi:hypothetical protein
LANELATKLNGWPNIWRRFKILASIQTLANAVSQRKNIGWAMCGCNPNAPLVPHVYLATVVWNCSRWQTSAKNCIGPKGSTGAG